MKLSENLVNDVKSETSSYTEYRIWNEERDWNEDTKRRRVGGVGNHGQDGKEQEVRLPFFNPVDWLSDIVYRTDYRCAPH